MRSLALMLCFAGLTLLTSSCASPLVGAECADGYDQCGERCVDTSTSRLHCGACDNACLPPATCGAGVCSVGDGGLDGSMSDADAGPMDSGPDDGGDGGPGDGGDASNGDSGFDGGDGGPGDGGPGDGGPGDGGPGDGGGDAGCSCDLGELCCGVSCVRPDIDHDNCGACGLACAFDEVCSDSACAAICDPMLTLCAGGCVDAQADPDHCGGCGVSCASGICSAGMCSAAIGGHVIVVGHDYRNSRPGMNRVAGNSVLLAPGAPVQVLVYRGAADDSSVRGVDAAVDQVARERGRSWTRSEGIATEIPLMLDGADAFVIYPQDSTTDGELRALGAEWSTALMSFLRRGGVVVLFDGGGSHMGTWQILDEAGLISATGRVEVSLADLDVVARTDAVAAGVPLRYRAESNSVRFITSDSTVVVEHTDGPVVVHEFIGP